jgi:hypothetical protein
MKMYFKDLLVGSCFMDAKGDMKKKVSDGKASGFQLNGKVSTRKVKGNPEVEQSSCELRFLGVGLRRHPEVVVEIGDGNPYKNGRRKKT